MIRCGSFCLKQKHIIMKKYSRTQEKIVRRKASVEYHIEIFEDRYEYFLEEEFFPIENCSCIDCKSFRMEKLKIGLYQKFKNKHSVLTLNFSFS